MDKSLEQELRERAQEILKKRGKSFFKNYEKHDPKELLQELDIYQAELEAQNDELNHTLTKLTNAELEYESLFSSSPIPTILIDELLSIKKINDVAQRYFNQNSASYRDKLFLSLIEHNGIQDFMSWIHSANVLRTKLLISLLTNDGPKTFEISATQHSYHINHFILTLVDKEDERQLIISNQEAVQNNRYLEDALTMQQEKSIKNYQQVLYSLLDMVEKRDTYTAGHSQRVAEYCVLIAEAMGIDQNDIDVLYDAAIMHDIGKVSIPDSILLKPGKLTHNEYAIIKKHLDYGYEILNSIESFKEHAQIVRAHHERYDGKGYPRGLKKDEIPLLSHIMIVADAFDAMTSHRIYKPYKTINQALEELKQLSGTQFHPEVIIRAVPALRNTGVLPIGHNYISDTLEEARVAFYYKDELTSLYNYHYFEHIMFFTQHIQSKHLQCCYFIKVKNFSKFNQTYGWLEGDKKLKNIASKLEKKFPESMLFRVYGDDFLIINEEHCSVKKEEIRELLNIQKENSDLDIELFHLKLTDIEVSDFDEFSNYLEALLDVHKDLDCT